jgi:hypothetical protein
MDDLIEAGNDWANAQGTREICYPVKEHKNKDGSPTPETMERQYHALTAWSERSLLTPVSAKALGIAIPDTVPARADRLAE